ncbi:MAG: extracellular solute-binding protein [Treponema sp.]|jgi:putative aldouronate transport system substrate-binding protein|nr:extracellular solute-binding protein [Treponema sp.]
MKKILFFLILVAVIVAAVSAGGGNQATASSPSGTAPVTFTIFVDHTWFRTNSFTGIIPDEITRITGVKLEPTVAINDQQLGIMIGSGSLPDLVYTQNLLDQLSHPDISYCLEDLIKQYNVDWQISPKRLAIGRLKSEENKAYTILNHFAEKSEWANTPAVQMLPSLIYRTDLYEAAGSPPVRSLDDLFNLYTRIKTANPNMTMLQLNAYWNVLYFRAQYGMPLDNYIEQANANYIHYTRDPRYKQTLAFLNKCWRAGFISPDEAYFVFGSEVPADGNYFSSTWCTQDVLPRLLAQHRNINPNWGLAEMVPFEGASYVSSSIGWSGTFITKRNKNPERAVRFLQFMFSDEGQKLTQMGRPGIDYTMTSSGMPEFSADWKKAIADGTIDKLYNPLFYLGGSPIIESLSRIAPTDPALVTETYKYMRDHYDNYPWVLAAEPIGTSDEKVIQDKIVELIRTAERQIIMANSETQFESRFQEYLNNANQIGIARVEQFVTNKVKQVKPMFQ